MTLDEFMTLTNMSVEQLAEKVDRSTTNVSRWRRGITKPDFEALVFIQRLSNNQVLPSDFAETKRAAKEQA